MGAGRLRAWTAVVVALVTLGAAAWWLGRADAPTAVRARLGVVESLAGDGAEAGHARADGPREFRFPADHGPHPDFRTEWWYLTGNLEGGDGRRFGYQLTLFRNAVAPPAAEPEDRSPWATRQVWMAHLAVTDAAGGRFFADERFSRGAVGLAGADAEPFRAWVEGWEMRSEAGRGAPPGEPTGRPAAGFPWRVRADGGEAGGTFAIDLRLAAGKGPVLQGDAGLSRKGPGEGQASYYYSYPRMPTEGTVSVGGEIHRVEGASWLDREWSTSLLGEGEEGWDWFALQLDDGRELVLYRIRGAGDAGGLDYAALVPADPATAGPSGTRLLDVSGSRLAVLERWRSRTTAVEYPVAWRLLLPAEGLNLEVRPLLPDQELDLAFRYWEGAVTVRGLQAEQPVTGRGYAELTGYGDGAGPTR